jgi:hypothetical protein
MSGKKSKGGPPFSKLDGGFFSNRKILRAGRNGRDVYLHVLCCNTKRGAKGWIPAEDLEPWYVADQLRISEEDARDGVTKAVTAKLIAIDGDAVTIKGWDADWAWRPLTRAEIQKNYRDRQEGNESRYQDEVTSYQEVSALPVEERREEKREKKARYAPGSLSGSDLAEPAENTDRPDTTTPRTSSRPEAGQPLSSTWQPSAATIAVAQSLGLDPAHEAQQFRLNAAARGHRFVDPDAAFEKFFRGSRDIGKRPKPKPGAYAASSKPKRYRTELGDLVEELDDGTVRRVGESAPENRQGNGA